MPNLRRGMMGAAGASAGAAGYVTWGMGQNSINHNHLADGTVIDRSSPVVVGTTSGPVWRALTYFSSGGGANATGNISSSNELFMWGAGVDGSLGNGLGGEITGSSSPLQIGALTDWAVLGTGNDRSIALKKDGSIWSWGKASTGFLGHGDVVNVSSPVQVGSLTDWAKVQTGSENWAAIKTDGTLWVCGANTNGQCGLGDALNRSSPTQVGSLTTWAEVFCGHKDVYAIKTDGTLWSIGGFNYKGACGLGDEYPVQHSSPVQIGSNTNWTQVAGRDHGASAINSAGKLYGWGINSDGQIGNGTVVHSSVPVQAGSLTDWVQTGAKNASSIALNNAGKAYTWGQPDNGQLGHNDVIPSSSPLQVGTATDWLYVGATSRTGLMQKAE